MYTVYDFTLRSEHHAMRHEVHYPDGAEASGADDRGVVRSDILFCFGFDIDDVKLGARRDTIETPPAGPDVC